METKSDASTTFLRYESNRVLLGISEDELDQIQNSSSNIFKDICLTMFGLAIPFLINAINEYNENQKKWNDNSVINLVCGAAAAAIFLVCIGFAIQKHCQQKGIIRKIKARPISILKKDNHEEQSNTSTVIIPQV
jgi:hypothetical protein